MAHPRACSVSGVDATELKPGCLRDALLEVGAAVSKFNTLCLNLAQRIPEHKEAFYTAAKAFMDADVKACQTLAAAAQKQAAKS